MQVVTAEVFDNRTGVGGNHHQRQPSGSVKRRPEKGRSLLPARSA